MDHYLIKKKLIKWYDNNKRNLPWRSNSLHKKQIPYNILVSEFMLQQTTVPTVIKKYKVFIKLWPTLEKLSLTNEKKILKFWSGLGYYNRALNLLKCAKIIRKNYNCKIPSDFNDLIHLPGVGKYTALAIQGIAFNKPVMAVDSNIERIITRIHNLSSPVSLIKKKIEQHSKKLIYRKHPGDMIQSLMDFGSIICRPRNPFCKQCVINNYCKAYAQNLTRDIPVKSTKKNKKKPIKYAYAFILIKKNMILLRKRDKKGMFPSMLEVPTSNWLTRPLVKKEKNISSPLKIKYKKIQEKLIYSFSHFDLKITIYSAKTKKLFIKNCKWYPLNKIDSLELPTLMKKIIKLYFDNK